MGISVYIPYLRVVNAGLYHRVISTLNGVTLIITLLITDILSPLGLQVNLKRRRSLLPLSRGEGCAASDPARAEDDRVLNHL